MIVYLIGAYLIGVAFVVGFNFDGIVYDIEDKYYSDALATVLIAVTWPLILLYLAILYIVEKLAV